MELDQFSTPHQEYIKNKQVALGMTQQAIRFSWGSPSSVQIKEDTNGVMNEEWVYKSFGSSVTTLIFTDSILTGIVSGAGRNPFTFSRKDRREQPVQPSQSESNPKIIQTQ